jgi:hypothetical protein
MYWNKTDTLFIFSLFSHYISTCSALAICPSSGGNNVYMRQLVRVVRLSQLSAARWQLTKTYNLLVARILRWLLVVSKICASYRGVWSVRKREPWEHTMYFLSILQKPIEIDSSLRYCTITVTIVQTDKWQQNVRLAEIKHFNCIISALINSSTMPYLSFKNILFFPTDSRFHVGQWLPSGSISKRLYS